MSMLDHAIWTVAVVSHLVVADHQQVEAPVMEIADVIAHAMHFRLLLAVSHQQMEEMSPGGSGGPGGPGQGGPGGHGPRGTSGS